MGGRSASGRRGLSYDDRFRKVLSLAEALSERREEILRQAARDIQFTVKDTAAEIDIAIGRLKLFADARTFLEGRRPLGGEGSSVSLMLSYNGSAWLNTAITSIFMAGSRVNVKFSSKGSGLADLTESIYGPIFGGAVTFYRGSGKSFVKQSLLDPGVSTIVIFGFDENVLPYENAFRNSGKKLVFEGPGQDPFIVFPDADQELALSDLTTAKFMYSGQTCTAPKRIFLHREIHDAFLDRFRDRAARLAVGPAEDPRTDVSPVASALAVARIREQLSDAVAKGATIVLGGKIEGNLVHPTIVRDATDDMLGMREEVFGPVAFTTSFDATEEVIRRAKAHKYGLRASVFGGPRAQETARELAGGDYCHPVPGYTFGRFGTTGLNQSRAESWKGAFVTKAVGGYGYSGWIWETVDGAFRIKQGPKLLSTETSLPA